MGMNSIKAVKLILKNETYGDYQIIVFSFVITIGIFFAAL